MTQKGLVRVLEKPGNVAVQLSGVSVMSERLEKLGFKGVAGKLETAQRLAIAYATYGHITQEAVNKFNAKLRKETLRDKPDSYQFKRLLFTPIADYGKIPPPDVLAKVEEAIKDEIFDSFEVATIQWIVELKDPIVFGRIKGCNDYFYVAQWDDDVKIEDIIGA